MDIYTHLHELRKITIPNKYTGWYSALIKTASERFDIDRNVQITQNTRRARKQLGYAEGHHIIPRSIGPKFSNNHFNIVYLTAKEHFIAHLLLTKMFYGGEQAKMIFAFRRMHHGNNGQRYFSKNFNNLKSQMPPANLGKVQISNGVDTKLHVKTEPIPNGWHLGAGSAYTDARKISNRKLHGKTYKVFDIQKKSTQLIDNLKEWATTVNIPYSTLTSAVKAGSVVRKLYIIQEVRI